MAKPSILEDVPASTSKFFDYAAIHVNLTASIHMDGIFLSWHRHFLHLMETELHNCGYPPGLGIPYWNYTRYPTLESSPLFDGSDTSLGGNGDYDPDAPQGSLPSGALLPRGTGGGCVTTGPFANLTVQLGPIAFSQVFKGGPPANWTVPNPRCLTRDLNDWGVSTYLSQDDIDAELARDNIGDFQYYINAVGNTAGLHGGGHYSVGGIMFDFFASPQDPAFYLHHGMLDLLWANWQAANDSRRYAWNGTSSISNMNTTTAVNNSTTLDFGQLANTVTVENVADPLSGFYCYRYI
ncbi:putative Tyrosinase copper-binding domain-containing protein [Seiridium cardinale]